MFVWGVGVKKLMWGPLFTWGLRVGGVGCDLGGAQLGGLGPVLTSF